MLVGLDRIGLGLGSDWIGIELNWLIALNSFMKVVYEMEEYATASFDLVSNGEKVTTAQVLLSYSKVE